MFNRSIPGHEIIKFFNKIPPPALMFLMKLFFFTLICCKATKCWFLSTPWNPYPMCRFHFKLWHSFGYKFPAFPVHSQANNTSSPHTAFKSNKCSLQEYTIPAPKRGRGINWLSGAVQPSMLHVFISFSYFIPYYYLAWVISYISHTISVMDFFPIQSL